MESGGCCPPLSWPKLASTHTPKGENVVIPGTDLTLYIVGSGNEVIIHFYDIWGSEGGRTKFMCDQLAELKGFKVVVPDYYRGQTYGDAPKEPEKVIEFVKKFKPEAVVSDTEKTIEYLKSQGATKFGATTTCWGTWALFVSCAKGLPFTVGVNYHPSLGLAQVFGSSALELAKQVKFPQLIISTSNEPDDVKPGGDVIKALQENGVTVECRLYLDMVHGFVPRGDLSDPKVARDCEDAVNMGYSFLWHYMKS